MIVNYDDGDGGDYDYGGVGGGGGGGGGGGDAAGPNLPDFLESLSALISSRSMMCRYFRS